MQKSIFVCVLALSLCLTATARPDGVTEPPTNPKVTEATTVTIAPNGTSTKADKNNASTLPATSTAVPTAVTNGTSTATAATPNQANNTKPNETKPDATTPVPTGTTTATPSPASITTPKPSSTSAPTPAPAPTKTPVSTTEHAKLASTTAAPVLAARGFDGASFIGGIVLALGLLAIGFMGFKYYKTQTERNYHTL